MIYLALICGLQVVLIAGLIWDRRSERQEVARERGDLLQHAHDREQGLLQRIQAPDTAVIQHYNETTPVSAPAAVRTDDEADADEDWWAKVNSVTAAELADLAAEQEVTGG